ncbi:hypothetical protein FRB93_010737 [Tulasnella sp. JGI-2019a]|nr:hypothetical protein FRB93_010737 [Tulasnella sp. JGI-2019a]
MFVPDASSSQNCSMVWSILKFPTYLGLRSGTTPGDENHKGTSSTPNEGAQARRRNKGPAAQNTGDHPKVWEYPCKKMEGRVYWQAYTQGLRKCRNDTIHVHQLPLETILRVFELSLHVDEPKYPSHLSRLQRLASVCTRWCDAVKHSPMLWRIARSSDPLRIVRIFLSRSQNVPLHVFVGDAGYTNPAIAPFLLCTLPHSRRWSALRIDGLERSAELLRRVLDVPTPILKELRISRDRRLGGSIDIPNEELTHLRHLHLQGSVIRFDPGALSGLTTLCLYGLSDPTCPSISEILSILRNSTAIVQLTLGDINPPGEIPLNYPILQLEHLTDLALRKLTCQLTHDILTLLRMPICRRYVIKAGRD